MALQGTIDTFPLTDVLALLEASAKTGLLTLTGDRGSGQVWLDGDNFLGGALDDATPLAADRLLFELLRFEQGSFEFSALDPGEFPSFDETPMQIKSCVESARKMLEQWERIESIVPSVDHRPSLAPELPVAQLSVDAELWSFLVAVSTSDTVADAAHKLGMDAYEGSAVIASLIEQQLVTIAEPAPLDQLTALAHKATRTDPTEGESLEASAGDEIVTDVDPSAGDSTLIEDLQKEEAMWDEPMSDFPERFPIDDLLDDDSQSEDDLWASPAMAQLEAQRREDARTAGEDTFAGLPEIESVPLSNAGFGHGAPQVNGSGLRDWDEMVEMEPLRTSGGNTPEETADEVLRQMSKLSPKAAEAIAAALESAADDDNSSAGMQNDSAGRGPVSFLDSF